jgi:hypothetical protein
MLKRLLKKESCRNKVISILYLLDNVIFSRPKITSKCMEKMVKSLLKI